ncbi:hypothetical protein NLG97_g201 [Lecanicillium saksenae]|uniref:Uncharacterized protein n=1 Tax=Lecanicillium saksenae TaxID=468837 RepID=A0ACC1R8G8_9HYPO|nr:hypothetical protein NLG97_g201 [Lecanicillium saksenae]
MTSILTTGQALSVDQSLTSPNGRFALTLQADGNLVLHTGSTALWTSQTAGRYAVQDVIMQGDGNFVMYDNSGHPIWSSGSATQDAISPYIQIQDDGNLVVYAIHSLWATNTGT